MTPDAREDSSTNDHTPAAKSQSGPDREFTVAVADVLQDRSRICALWRTGLNATGLYEERFDWFHSGNPAGAPDALLLLRRGDSEAAGSQSLQHREMRLNNTLLRAGILMNFVVRPAYRTFFPALLLQREVRRFALTNHQLVLGLPNPGATAVIGRAGYLCVGQMVRYVRVVHCAEYLARHLPRSVSLAVGPIIDWVRHGAHLLRGVRRKVYACQWQSHPDARFTELWERSTVPHELMGIRDEPYLTWRFVDWPVRQIRFFTLVSVVDQRLVAFAACEISQSGLRVRDFLVDPKAHDAGASLWRELANHAFRAGCSSVSTEFLGGERIKQELMAAGLTARGQRPLYAAADPSIELLQECNLYLTGADEDV